MGRFDEALAAHQRAIAVDPLSPVARFNEALTLCLMNQIERAVDRVRTALDLFPGNMLGYHHASLIFLSAGLLDKAETIVNRGLSVDPENHFLLKAAPRVFRRKPDRVMELLGRVRQISLRKPLPPVVFGMVHLSLSDLDTGFAWLRRCVDEHDVNFLTELHDPALDDARRDPRFKVLLDKVGLSSVQGMKGRTQSH